MDTLTGKDQVIRDIVSSIRRIVRAIYLDSKQMVKTYGLTGPQSLVINALAHHSALSSADLSRKLFVTPSNITGIIDRLEAKDLITRVRNAEDRRVVFIKLTDKGRQISKSLPDLIEDKLVQGLSHMSDVEVAPLLTAVVQIVDLIDAKKIDIAPLEPDF